MKQVFSLIDINKMYWACQVAFNPSLRGKPGAILTNNDGCLIAVNDEAKAMGLKLGDPWFKIKDDPRYKGLVVFSSNYPLYATVSDDVMSILSEFSPVQEIYSIDECFLDMTGMPGRMVTIGLAMRRRLLKEARVPACVGFGSTKTLAKLANRIAKKNPQFEGVVDLNEWPPHRMIEHFSQIPVIDIWGVGEMRAARLAKMDIHTAMDLKLANTEYIRQQFSIVLERTVRELNGESCIPIELERADKKQIMSSRSFGHPVEDIESISQAVAAYVSRAAEKLRGQKSHASIISVFIQTSRFADGPKYNKPPMTLALPAPTDDTLKLNAVAQWILKKIYMPGFRYHKAGIMLDGIVPAGLGQSDMFGFQPTVSKRDQLMSTLDGINAKFGKNVVRVGSMGHKQPWAMKQDYLSPRYTTNIKDLPIAK